MGIDDDVAAGEQTSTTWHGQFELAENSVGRWRIGPLSLWIQRLKGEWRIARETAEDQLDGRLELELPTQVDDLMSMEVVDRFGCSTDSAVVELAPQLADRPVVARPEKPFHLPSGEQVTVFVGVPLWVKVSVGRPAVQLLDTPIVRPSDTWFGPTTMEGELCYASRTYLRLNQHSVTRIPHRALSVVNILNRSETALSIESLRLPVSRFSLFQAADGQLWTQDVTFERDKAEDFASLRTRQQPPSQAPEAVPVTPPRQTGEENMVVRAFSAIFS